MYTKNWNWLSYSLFVYLYASFFHWNIILMARVNTSSVSDNLLELLSTKTLGEDSTVYQSWLIVTCLFGTKVIRVITTHTYYVSTLNKHLTTITSYYKLTKFVICIHRWCYIEQFSDNLKKVIDITILSKNIIVDGCFFFLIVPVAIFTFFCHLQGSIGQWPFWGGNINIIRASWNIIARWNILL